ncbi:MAG: thiamine diphosphokinase [Pseudomonadota bacterium]
MTTPKLRFDQPVTLLGGGGISPKVTRYIGYEPLICADSGADQALKLGRQPDAVIGDLDSISDAARAAFGDVIHEVAEQDSTDFEKCLNAIDAPFIFGFGFLGRRMDHTIASLSILSKYHSTPIALVGQGDVTLCLSGEVTIPVKPGSTVGILPWPAAVCESDGLRWELNDLDLTLGGQISSSNEAIKPEIHIKILEGAILLTLPARGLDRLPSAFGLSLGS